MGLKIVITGGVAGCLALLGGLLPGFHWIAVVTGAGLLFAGASGTCGMAAALARMPWNKPGVPSKNATSACGPRCT